jgi:hypothetical protein
MEGKLAFRREPEWVWIMSDDQEIVQTRFGYTNRFHFGEDQLKFTSRDSSGESTRSINYDTINLDKSSTLKINAGRRYSLIIVIIGTALTMTIQSLYPGRLDFAWAAAGISSRRISCCGT